MLRLKITFLLCLSFLCFVATAQKTILSGPMLGYVEHREALIWYEVRTDITNSFSVRFKKKNGNDTLRVARQIEYAAHGTNAETATIKFICDNLEFGTTYEYSFYVDEELQATPYVTQFKTKELWEWRKPAPDFNFLMGSCFYMNDTPYDRPGKPYGQDPHILETMGNTQSDLMLWLGDNLYYREADYSTESGMEYRYGFNFRLPEFQKLRATRANYAIWDDHDYGPDDSEGTFELKEKSLELFKNYWGNKTYGQQEHAGVYHKFKWSDCEFFMLDDRYNRTPKQLRDSVDGKPNADKIIFGEAQMQWLKNSLAVSTATFKFIVTGGQALNALGTEETLLHYPIECNDLINFVANQKISGLVFLTGDRHFTEMINYKPRADFYAIPEYTSSAVTAGSSKPSKAEVNNPQRVEGSLFLGNNFGRLSVSGTPKNRTLIIETLDAKGDVKWKKEISQNELVPTR